MQIGELSARTGTSVRMLRYYEEQGLLSPRRTGARYRVYDESDIDRVARIRCMLSAALPSGVVGHALKVLLDERAVIPEEPAERALLADRLQGELDLLAEKIASLERSRDLLARIVADVRGAVVGPGRPGEPGCASDHHPVRKSGPAVGRVRTGTATGTKTAAGTETTTGTRTAAGTGTAAGTATAAQPRRRPSPSPAPVTG